MCVVMLWSVAQSHEPPAAAPRPTDHPIPELPNNHPNQEGLIRRHSHMCGDRLELTLNLQSMSASMALLSLHDWLNGLL